MRLREALLIIMSWGLRSVVRMSYTLFATKCMSRIHPKPLSLWAIYNAALCNRKLRRNGAHAYKID